ncbi:hypothetical protein SCHPADRAFT_939987 [Schizopora paradoxa]|uniref:Protein kinase domain-containing protein n=1 Tax=Schizopora paradoxa TaxID=27342 RepID=A0A0H2RPQ7_9AGAM|nr:hypothetical protein SCHPADRAFT_939987 [Schizopora paradoxa]
MYRLSKIFTSLSHVCLEGRIEQKQPYASGLGGSCDVFTVWSTEHDKKLAVKQKRAFFDKEPSLAKAKLKHENVLPLLGNITEGTEFITSLVSEWKEKATFKTFPRGGIETSTILRDMASGLAYLRSKDVLHADLKAVGFFNSQTGFCRNFFRDVFDKIFPSPPPKTPVHAAFGLSLTLSHSQSTTETMAPASTKESIR